MRIIDLTPAAFNALTGGSVAQGILDDVGTNPDRVPKIQPMKFGGWSRLALILVFVLTVPLKSWPESAVGISTKPLLVSFPMVKLGKTERIGSFKCTIRPAQILSLREFPDEWRITIQNGDSETATIEGQMLVGTGAFSAGDDYFTRFMTIEVADPSPRATIGH